MKLNLNNLRHLSTYKDMFPSYNYAFFVSEHPTSCLIGTNKQYDTM